MFHYKLYGIVALFTESIIITSARFVRCRADVFFELNMILPFDKDPMGCAIYDYHCQRELAPLVVHSSLFDDDEMEIAHLFRPLSDMPKIEQQALSWIINHSAAQADKKKIKILDVGAAAGCHCAPLEQYNCEIQAIDVSPLAVQTLRERGISANLCDFFVDDCGKDYDVILCLMNGIGLCGTFGRLPLFFHRLDQLLAPKGCALVDSCDIAHIVADDDGNIPSILCENGRYYGEVDYQMEYKEHLGLPFTWLYLDEKNFIVQAQQAGFCCEILCRGEAEDFLAKLSRK